MFCLYLKHIYCYSILLPMLSDQLKEQTLAPHQQLEKKLVAQMKGINTTGDYAQILQLFYGYFGGLEQQINYFIGSEQLADFNERRKTEAIADDIKSLGHQPVDVAQGSALPEITNVLQAFGALYVIEGSTLGGSIISKMISGKLGINNGLSFFNSYGDNTMNMWAKFRHVLNELPADELTAATIVAAANETFTRFSEWFDKQQTNAVL